MENLENLHVRESNILESLFITAVDNEATLAEFDKNTLVFHSQFPNFAEFYEKCR